MATSSPEVEGPLDAAKLVLDGHVQLFVTDSKTAILRLNNPTKMNALDMEMADAFGEAINHIEAELLEEVWRNTPPLP